MRGSQLRTIDRLERAARARIRALCLDRRPITGIVRLGKPALHASVKDEWSPFCLIARNNRDADAIQEYVDAFFAGDSQLTLRNDIYGRLSHTDFTKGTALAELARQLDIPRGGIFSRRSLERPLHVAA